MHIPDAYLSPATEAVAIVIMIPLWATAARITAKNLNTKQAPLLSIGAAFCFAIQMFNIPTLGGTTAHALGATLLAILVGPWAALLGMTLSLSIQALLFGDGGILAIGANCWDMGFVACFVGYGVYKSICGNSPQLTKRKIVAAGVGSYVGTVTAALSAGILLGIQPAIAHDSAGHALYCPFGLNISVPAMVMSHLLIAGPAEAIITIAALTYLWRAFPEYATESARPRLDSNFRLVRSFLWLLVLTPLGLLAAGDAFGEWDLETLAKKIGYAPAGIAHTHELVHPLLPDYGFAGSTGRPLQIVGYLASAFLGCGLVAIFTRGILRPRKSIHVIQHLPGQPGRTLPDWLRQPNPLASTVEDVRSPWLERTMLQMAGSIEKTIVAERIAHSNGWLQSIHPLAKTLGFLFALVGVGLASSPWLLAAIIVIVLFCSGRSLVPLRPLVLRVAELVTFFGLIFAGPVSLRLVTPGSVAFSILGLEFSMAGLHYATLILLRLAAGIIVAAVWNLTTKWHDLIRSFRSIGVPQVFLTSATLTYRYLFVLIESLSEMVEARSLRQIGRSDKHQSRVYAGNGTAILFSKSLAFTEEMHQAMNSRCFDPTRRIPYSQQWKGTDTGFVFGGAVCFGVAVLMGALHAL